MNWSATEEVEYEITVLGGPTAEETLGSESGNAAPLASDGTFSWLSPSPLPGAGWNVTFGSVSVNIIGRAPAVRVADSVSKTFLGFNKAAYEGLSYREFLEALGLSH